MAEKRKRQSKQARKSNIQVFGTKEDEVPVGDWYKFKKAMPRSKTDFNKITSKLCDEVAKPGDSNMVAKVPLEVARRIYEIGIRKNVQEIPDIVCPKCGELHPVICDKCGKKHTIEILDSSAEKNSLSCLQFLGNKWFPNKAPIAQDFDQSLFIEKVTVFVAKVISVLPGELQKTYTEEWIKTVTELESDNG